MYILEIVAEDVYRTILHKIVVLAQDRIRFLLDKLNQPYIHTAVKLAMEKLNNKEPVSDDAGEVKFRQWICNLPLLSSLDSGSDCADLIHHIKWASEARWVYSEQLESFLAPQNEELPVWLKTIYKLGRYQTAAKTMVKLAIKQPAVFTGIHIEPVQAPERTRFSLGKEQLPLLNVLKKITKTNAEELKERLSQIWLTKDPELRFRQACRIENTVHAEMQLLSFYDHDPSFTPRLLFMGTSKKACYLCHEFMSRHPLAISMSATHQKLYPTWMPAPCSSAVRKKHKVLLWEFSRHLEQVTARDLETRLGIRRPNTMDSTAGPSLTSSWTESTGGWSQELTLRGFDIGKSEIEELLG